VLPYPQVSHETVTRRALARRKPFTGTKRGTVGYRDSLIWESVVGLAEKGDEEPIAFVTSNTADFSLDRAGRELHRDLAVDLKWRDIPPSLINLYPDLKTFVEEKVKPDLNLEPQIRAKMEGGEYFDVRRWLDENTDEICRAINGPGFREFFGLYGGRWGFVPTGSDYGVAIGFKEAERVRVERIKNITGVTVQEVRRMSETDLLIKVEIQSDCVFTVVDETKRFASDQYGSAAPILPNPDFDEQEAKYVTDRSVIAEMSFELDTERMEARPASLQVVDMRDVASGSDGSA